MLRLIFMLGILWPTSQAFAKYQFKDNSLLVPVNVNPSRIENLDLEGFLQLKFSRRPCFSSDKSKGIFYLWFTDNYCSLQIFRSFSTNIDKFLVLSSKLLENSVSEEEIYLLYDINHPSINIGRLTKIREFTTVTETFTGYRYWPETCTRSKVKDISIIPYRLLENYNKCNSFKETLGKWEEDKVLAEVSFVIDSLCTKEFKQTCSIKLNGDGTIGLVINE
ncbi:MAG: hypothetical protein AB8G05_28350 [Oligoflexales bacterium]